MTSDSVPNPSAVRRAWIPICVLAIGLLFTLAVALYDTLSVEAKDRLRFQNAVQQTQDNIRDRLDTYVALLRAGAGLFAADAHVSRTEFKAFVDRLDLPTHYPGIQGIGFSQRILPEEREAVLAEMHLEGMPSFHIWPEGARDQVHAILYLEPLDRRNQQAIGYDMFSEPIRRAAMERARDSGMPAASEKVILVQEIDAHKQAGFLIYVPVYRQGTQPTTVAERRAMLLGFVYAPFRADDLSKGILGAEPRSGIDLQVYDGLATFPMALLHDSGRLRPTGTANHPPRFQTSSTLFIAGRPWTLVYTTRPEFDAPSGLSYVPLIVILGTLISLVLFIVTRSQAQAQRTAERIAADLQRSTHALQVSEARLQRLVDANIIGILIADLQGQVLEANDAFLNLVGFSREDMAKHRVNWAALTPPEYHDQDLQAMEQMRRTGSHPPFEKEFLRKDGTRVPVLIGTAYLGGPEDLGVGFLLDLTELKRAYAALEKNQQHIQALNQRLQRAMTETHHRVKNNLQIIAAMLDMQLMEDSPTVSTKELSRLATHINTMAVVHDILTGRAKEDGQAEFIAAREILQKLLPLLQQTAERRPIRLTLGDAPLTAQQGTSLALIANELVNNAIKYGKGEIEVSFAACGDHASLQVCDDGPGFPADFDPARSANTGWELVQQLSRWDLRGDWCLENRPEGGARVTITFPLPENAVSNLRLERV